MPGKGKSIEIFLVDCEKVIKNNIMMVVGISSLCQHPVIDVLHTKGFAAMMETELSLNANVLLFNIL